MLELLAFAVLGVLTGVLGGLLGIGGGLVLVPVLHQVFVQQGVSADIIMHLALATSLASIIVTALAAIRAHQRRGAIRWDWLRLLLPGVIVGCVIGALLADALSSHTLRIGFGVFECLVGLYMLLDSPLPAAERRVPVWLQHLTGTSIGVLSALLGIGGGTLTVPFLATCRVVMVQAVATASALGLPIAIAASVAYAVAGWGHPHLPAGSLGYIYLAALIPIAAGTLLGAPVGVRLAHQLPAGTLRRVFAGVLILVGARMLWG